MNTIKTYDVTTPEYARLRAVANLLTNCSCKGYKYVVQDVYWDLGQDWMWTTIVCINPNSTGFVNSWQILSPKEHADIITATSPKNMTEAITKLVNDTYWQDKEGK